VEKDRPCPGQLEDSDDGRIQILLCQAHLGLNLNSTKHSHRSAKSNLRQLLSLSTQVIGQQ
jgi:hypothetical protein